MRPGIIEGNEEEGKVEKMVGLSSYFKYSIWRATHQSYTKDRNILNSTNVDLEHK